MPRNAILHIKPQNVFNIIQGTRHICMNQLYIALTHNKSLKEKPYLEDLKIEYFSRCGAIFNKQSTVNTDRFYLY